LKREIFANLSPLDHRYSVDEDKLWSELSNYLSEEAGIRYLLKVEAALAKALAALQVAPATSAREIEEACLQVTPDEVLAEEAKTRHNIRALVNCIQAKVTPEARPWVHFTATSADIMDTANAARFKEFTNKVFLPELKNLLATMIQLALENKDTLQVGRTHGQYAVPITFGYVISGYVERLGTAYQRIDQAAQDLRGKMAGAVGAYNASSLVVSDPLELEALVMQELGLKASPFATQIVEPEYILHLMHEYVTCLGILANFADDMRHLQRSEIKEVGEFFAPNQVGSSTMPHKRNPWNYEHVKSLWKTFMPRIITVYMDQISEHQRDLSNSASSRFLAELAAGTTLALRRINKVTAKLSVHHESMQANFAEAAKMIVAEPLYILLASAGHPDAHEAVRLITLEAENTRQPVAELAKKHSELAPYIQKLSPSQLAVLEDPGLYIGQASRKTELICRKWTMELFEGSR